MPNWALQCGIVEEAIGIQAFQREPKLQWRSRAHWLKSSYFSTGKHQQLHQNKYMYECKMIYSDSCCDYRKLQHFGIIFKNVFGCDKHKNETVTSVGTKFKAVARRFSPIKSATTILCKSLYMSTLASWKDHQSNPHDQSESRITCGFDQYIAEKM